jgi:hypothetical protein
MATRRYDMAFLADLALDANRIATASETRILDDMRAALEAADAVVIHIGGRSSRLGEAIIGTAFVEGTLQTLVFASKQRTPLTIIIDESIAELVVASEYRRRYWPEIEVVVAAPDGVERNGAASYASVMADNVLVLDFHAQHDGMPSLIIEIAE